MSVKRVMIPVSAFVLGVVIAASTESLANRQERGEYTICLEPCEQMRRDAMDELRENYTKCSLGDSSYEFCNAQFEATFDAISVAYSGCADGCN